MSKVCEVTGAGPRYGNNISHSKKHTRRRWEPNLKKKRIFLPEENRWITLRLSAAAIKSINKKGIGYLKKMAVLD